MRERTWRRAHPHGPGCHAPEYDPEGVEPWHIHFTCRAEGYRDRGGEVLFADDTRAAGSEEPALFVEVTSVEGDPRKASLTLRLVRDESTRSDPGIPSAAGPALNRDELVMKELSRRV